MSILPVYTDSFFTSKGRPDGMGLTILREDGVVYTNMFIDSRFEGYKGVVHGGMVFGVLDVIMWYTILLDTRENMHDAKNRNGISQARALQYDVSGGGAVGRG